MDLMNENLSALSFKSDASCSNADKIKRDYLEIFVLSEFGKPIYCHNKRDDQITLLPLCQALINYFNDTQNDNLKYVLLKSGLKITFSAKSPLIVVVINHQFSGLDSNLIINQIYAQIISTVTNKTLKSVFQQSATFDLRRLLGNSEKMIEYLVEDGLVARRLKNLKNKLINQLDDQLDNENSSNQSNLNNFNNQNGINEDSNSQLDNCSTGCNENDETIHCFLTSITQSYSNETRQNALAIGSSTSSNMTSNLYKPHLNKVMIPVLPLNQQLRDSITNILTSSIASSSNDILYSILIKFHNDLSLDENDKTVVNGNLVENCESVTSDSNADVNELECSQSTDDNKESNLNENGAGTESNENASASSTKESISSSIKQMLEESSDDLLNRELKPVATCHLVTIANQNTKIAKLNTLDAHIVINLNLCLKNQLNTVESLWLPICLPRFNNNAFMHAHFCLLNLSIENDQRNKFGLIQLTTNKEDFDKCQLARNIISDRLNKLKISSYTSFSKLNIPILHSFWYQSLRSQTIIWKSKYCLGKELCKNDYLIHYMAKRMIDSNLKTFWMRSDRHYIALLGWHSPTFQLYIQFDVIASKTIAINFAQNIIKWVKNEESNLVIKDYQ